MPIKADGSAVRWRRKIDYGTARRGSGIIQDLNLQWHRIAFQHPDGLVRSGHRTELTGLPQISQLEVDRSSGAVDGRNGKMIAAIAVRRCRHPRDAKAICHDKRAAKDCSSRIPWRQTLGGEIHTNAAGRLPDIIRHQHFQQSGKRGQKRGRLQTSAFDRNPRARPMVGKGKTCRLVRTRRRGDHTVKPAIAVRACRDARDTVPVSHRRGAAQHRQGRHVLRVILRGKGDGYSTCRETIHIGQPQA